MYPIVRILLVITLLSLPATSLADSASDLLGAPASSNLQTGSSVQSAPQSSTLQPQQDFINQSPADSASTLQGQTPTDQQKLLVENDGTPSPLPTGSADLEWWVIGIVIVAGLVYYWFGVLRESRRSLVRPKPQPAPPTEAKQLPPTKPKAQPKKKPTKNKSNGTKRKQTKKRSK